MGRSQESFNKKEKEKKRLKKRQDKLKKKEERKASGDGAASFDDMIAYVDEFGNITDTPPDETKKTEVDIESIEISVPKKEEEEVETERKGRVEFFNDSKGFGFIKEQDTGEKFFVHVSSLIDKVAENDRVIFEVEQGMKGLNAVNVKKA
ncbi:cold shock domain-containing protein [Persicobacter psychrovividus]|uniref:Cold-shock protein n=1 Tax=Persicobacter psychrovividus TaxID=387638 RepID=A0ABN6LGE3_9BACT|nr:cold-shock protein [Persicobacter psychrovividus]